MKYDKVVRGTFLDRPNRFIAHVLIDGKTETVHVKNTGRCRELLVEGAEIWLEYAESPARKTKYDLIAVRKSSGLLVNIDSQAPNKVAREWLETQGFDKIAPEYTYGNSRIDFYMEKDGERFLMEVKGCTLEIDGIGYFPDAPTERGVKHLRELARAVGEGYHAAVAFVIQMDDVTEVRAPGLWRCLAGGKGSRCGSAVPAMPRGAGFFDRSKFAPHNQRKALRPRTQARIRP